MQALTHAYACAHTFKWPFLRKTWVIRFPWETKGFEARSFYKPDALLVAEPSIFMAFGCYDFCTLGNEAKIIIVYYVVPCCLSTDPKIHDLEWPLYIKFSLLWTALIIYFYVHATELVYITWPVEMCRSGGWSAEYLGSVEILRIFLRHYIVRTLMNKAAT